MISIYLIEHTKSGKVYVGQSKEPNRRWSRHKRSLKTDKHHSIKLQRAWNKYGEDSFVFYIIDEFTSQSEADTFEELYIDIFQSMETGFNMVDTANRPPVHFGKDNVNFGKDISHYFKGKHHSLESKQIMSDKKRGLFDGTKNPMYGHHHTLESKNSMSILKLGKYEGVNNPMFGKTHTPEARKKIGDASRKRMSKLPAHILSVL